MVGIQVKIALSLQRRVQCRLIQFLRQIRGPWSQRLAALVKYLMRKGNGIKLPSLQRLVPHEHSWRRGLVT
jgi:hypothetical protein